MNRIFETHPRLASAACMAAVAVTIYASLGWGAGGTDRKFQQSRLLVAEQPKGAEPVLALQRAMVAESAKHGAPQSREVVLTGQIGGLPNLWPEQHPAFPWYEKQASLFLVDTKVAAQFAAHAKSHGGNHHNCAFCRALAAKNAHAIAVVNFVDENGEIIRVDSRELLDLKEHQTITVKGTAKLLGGSMLVIQADGVYVNR